MDMRRALGELRQELSRLTNSTVIVEGARDRSALRALGFQKIITLERGPIETALALVEKHDAGSILILTDFDAEGSRLAASLSGILEHMGTRVDRAARRRLKQKTVRAGLTVVEEYRKLAESVQLP